MELLVAIIICTFWVSCCYGDYTCLCNYNVEIPVYSSADKSSQLVGYMYEFDCKNLLSDADPVWSKIEFEHKVGFVEMIGQIRIQTCPGSIPDEDRIVISSVRTSAMLTAATKSSQTATTASTILPSSSGPFSSSSIPSSILSTATSSTISTITSSKRSTSASSSSFLFSLSSVSSLFSSSPPPSSPSKISSILSSLSHFPSSFTYLSPAKFSPSAVKTSSLSVPAASSPKISSSYSNVTFPNTYISTLMSLFIHSTVSSSNHSKTSSFLYPSSSPLALSIHSTDSSSIPLNSTSSFLNPSSTPLAGISFPKSSKSREYTSIYSNSAMFAVSSTTSPFNKLSTSTNKTFVNTAYSTNTKFVSNTTNYPSNASSSKFTSTQGTHLTVTSARLENSSNALSSKRSTVREETHTSAVPKTSNFPETKTPHSSSVSLASSTADPAILSNRTITESVITDTTKHPVSDRVDLCPYRNLAMSIYNTTTSTYPLFRQYGNYCYELRLKLGNWFEAQRDCVSRGGDLVVIQNEDVQTRVHNLTSSIKYSTDVWIGLHDIYQEGHWEWVSGAKLTRTSFNRGILINYAYSDTDDCVLMDGKSGVWKNTACKTILFDVQSFPWICQYTTNYK